MEPDMDHLCGRACCTWNAEESPQAPKMLQEHSGQMKSLSGRGWTEEESHWKTIPTLQQNKKEVGTRNHGNFHRMQKVYKDHRISAVTLKRRRRHAKDCTMNIQRSLQVETNISLQSNKSDKGAINSLKALMNTIIDLKLPQDGDTILLPRRIHLRHHDGNQAANCGQLGLGVRGTRHPWLNSSNFLLSLLRDVISLVNSTPTAHTYFHAQLLYSHLVTDLTHWPHASRVAQESRSTVLASWPKTVIFRRAMSYVTPHLITPSTGTPSSYVLHPPLSERKPCGDLRPHLSGALAEPRPFTSDGPKQLAENQDHRHFTGDKELTEHEDLRVKPMSSHQPITASTYDSAESIATSPLDSDLDDEQLRAVAGFTTVLTGARSKCRTIASSSLWTRNLMSSSSQDPISTGKFVALFSSTNRLNQDTFSDREDFPSRHQLVFGSNDPFFRCSNPANVAKSLLDGNRAHLLAEARSELMKQEYKVESLNTCISELQQQTYAQMLELEDAHFGDTESRREQFRLQDGLVMKEKALRDAEIRSMHEMGELKRELRNCELTISLDKNWEKVMIRYRSSLHKYRSCKRGCIASMIPENLRILNRITVEKLSHVPSQPAVVPSPRSMLSRDRSMPFDTWNLSDTQGNVFGNSRSMLDSSRTPYQGILHSTNPSATGAIPVQVSTSDLSRELKNELGAQH